MNTNVTMKAMNQRAVATRFTMGMIALKWLPDKVTRAKAESEEKTFPLESVNEVLVEAAILIDVVPDRRLDHTLRVATMFYNGDNRTRARSKTDCGGTS